MWTWGILIILQITQIWAQVVKVNVTAGDFYLELKWEETKNDVNYSLGYGTHGNITHKDISYTISTDNVATYLLNNLQPGETYELQLIKDGQEVFKSTRTTKPLPPTSIIVSEAGTRHLFFTWKTDVRSTQDSYRVRVTDVSNNSEIFKSDSIHVQFYNLTGLYPGLVYTIAIETISNGQISNGTTSIQDNTRPLSPTIHWIIAIDNYTLMLARREDFNSIQDRVQLTAVYNNTHNLTGEINLTCTMLLNTCWTLVPWVIPGTPIEVRAYAVKNNRRSDPDITYHSTKPETVSSLTEANSSTSFLQLSVTQPFHSVFVGYSVSIDDGYYYFRNYTFPADQSTFLIGNLTAGIEYNVSVGTMSEWEESSQQFSRLFYTYPNMPRNLRIYNGDINTTSLKVSWDPVTSGELDYYDVMISPKETLTHSPVLQYNTAMRTVTFDSLTPGRMYTITVKSVKAQKRSTAVTLIQYTKPNPPAKINYTVMGGREIYLNWYPPTTGVVENYTVSIVSLGMHGVTNNTLPIAPVTLQGTTYTLRQLHPGETYEISVTSRSGGVTSIPLKINATTDPTSVTEIFVDHVTENHINMSWSRPENLTFKTFKLTIDPPDTTSPVEILESAGILFHSFTGLHPGTVYNLSVFLMLGTAVIDKTIRTAITDPVPIDDINITTHDTSSLLLNWFVTRSLQQHHFELMYTSFDGSSNTSLPMVLAHSDQYSYQYTITKLNAGSMYTVYIRAVQEFDDLKSYSSWLKVNKTTKPKSVTKLSATVSNQDITLSWKPDVNSTQDNYIVWYRPMLAPFTQLGKQTNTQLQQTTLRGMYAGERYELIVFAVSMNEMSLPRSVFAEVPPLQPSSITATKVSTDSVSVTWTYNLSATYVEEFELTYTSYVSDSQGIMVVSGGNSTSVVTIGNLTSGEMYIVSILSVAANMTSEVASVNVTVKPLILTALLEYPGLTTSDKIGIQYTAVTNYFDYFKFTLVNDTSRPPVIKSRTDTDRLVTFDRLEGGTQYVVQVVTVSGAESSSPIYISILTAPNRPHVDQISTATEITLIVNKPSGRVDSYLIICALNSMPCGSQTIDASKDKVTVPFDKLTPYQKYKFQIVSFAGLKNMSFFLEIETAQAAPSAVHNLRAVETEPRMVTLTWNAPTVTNGIITAYIVEYKGRKTDLDPVIDSSVRTIIVDSSSAFNDPISYQIPQMLTAGLKYTFKVYGKTVANGPADQTDLTTRTYNPKLKDGISSDMAAPKPPKDRPATPTTIPVEFTNAFSEDYGEIIQYTIIVATSTDKDYLNTNTLPGWKAYQNDPSIKAYQAISNCSDFFDSDSTCGDRLRLQKRSATQGQNKIFVIGSEADCKDPHYCNGPLKQNTQYYFKLRAYTNGGYADTVYSSPFSTGSVTEASNYGGIIGGVVAAVVVIGLILLAVLFLRRNLRAKSNMYRQGQDHRMTPRSSIRGTKKKHEINILNFRDHVISLSADSDFKYAEEFEDLKEVGRDQSCSAAELPVNRGKNRFTNILPYDHSRVKLLPTDDEEGSDYINANYMPGFSSKREYIVTQGPLPSTRDDFWRMIWEQNSRNIVMLTKCVEKGREKCDQYWPVGSDAIFYGDIQVAVLNETKFPSWTITEFRIALGDLTRQIRHFHFTAWPDFGVPDKPQTLIRFVRIVREKLYRECGPMVVHCSAGVGRSGTYIALDRLLQDIIEHDIIDIFNVVAEMRKERVWMVQTEQQYVCIHQCLMCVLDGREEEHIYENSGNVNQAFEDDEGINVEVP